MRYYFETSLPTKASPHSIYFIKNGNNVTMYVTNAQGTPFQISSSGGGGGSEITLTSPEGTIYIDGYAIDISQSVLNQINSVHNLLSGLQGGQSGQYYHLTELQYQKLVALLYTNNITSIAVNPQSGEKGVSTPITVIYNINTGDDVFTSASINQGIGSVLANINQGTINVSGGSKTDTTTYSLSYTYTRNGLTNTEVKSANYVAYFPQWRGISADSTLDAANYATLNSNLTKTVQNTSAANTLSIDVAPINQYIYFISTKANASITNNGFLTDIQPWGDTVTGGFWRKSITVTLADSTTTTLYIYRTRQTRTHSQQNYTLT